MYFEILKGCIYGQDVQKSFPIITFVGPPIKTSEKAYVRSE